MMTLGQVWIFMDKDGDRIDRRIVTRIGGLIFTKYTQVYVHWIIKLRIRDTPDVNALKFSF